MPDYMRSPLPNSDQEQPVYSFYDALKFLAESEGGRKITRLEWGDKNTYGFMRGEILNIRTITNGEYKDNQWLLSLGDIVATDWIVLN